MTQPPEWLPALVNFTDYGGQWEPYCEALYEYFRHDFIESKPKFGGRTVQLKRHPLFQGKEATFWHITHEGRTENQRTPDLRRCERIRWPRPIIERPIIEHNCNGVIRCWPEKTGRDERIVLWIYELDYVVILNIRKGYILLWAAYYIIYDNKRRQLLKKYEKYIKNAGKS